MKIKIFFLFLFQLILSAAWSQGVDCANAITDKTYAWIEPSPTKVDQEVTIYVDLTKDPKCNKLVGSDGPLYLWTWGPKEDPVKQGSWNSSNELMKMEKKSDNIWIYKMIPTEFYGVDADRIYDRGICLLVKGKDGGSGGDCTTAGNEFKTNDAHIVVERPADAVRKVYSFPDVFAGDTLGITEEDPFTLFYDNSIEEKTTMQNLSEAWVYARAIGTDGKSYTIAIPAKIGDNPQLKMKSEGAGLFSWTVIPKQLFAAAPNPIPNGVGIARLRLQIVKVPLCGSDCAVQGDFFFSYRCK